MTDSGSEATRTALVEQLNTSWRIAGQPPAAPSFKHKLLQPIRLALARLLRPQETFNSQIVQYINMSLSTIERYRWALDDVERFRAALAARERRMEAEMAAMRAEHAELRTSVGVLQQATHNLSRSVARPPETPDQRSPDVTPAPPHGPETRHALSHTYVGFEDQFRGSSADIRGRLADYLPIFENAADLSAGASPKADVLDIGCGRGEFLELLRERGVRARGIDLNEAMVAVCRSRGLEATIADALSYLSDQPDGSLGGLFAAQVVEHLEPPYLTRLLETAFHKLRPGSPIVLETINPACWFAFFESYIRDITHVRPLHPDTLKFLLVANGFQQVEIRYRAPYPEHDKLQPVPAAAPLVDIAETLNANVEKLNRLLFTYLDYAAVARRP
jgi:SAM-dependent methyltransferase